MKKLIILSGILSLSGMLNAQWNGTCPLTTTCLSVGIGTTAPVNNLHIVNYAQANSGGVTVEKHSSAAGASGITMLNHTTGGKDWGIYSLGLNDGAGAGNFSIYDLTTGTNRFFISGSTGNTGIGSTSPSSMLHVVGAATAVRGDANAAGGNGTGVAGNGIGSSNSGNVAGVVGSAVDGAINYGGYFIAKGNSAGVTSYGVYTSVSFPTSGSTNYGIYSSVGGNTGSGTGPNYAGYFDGDIVTTTNLWTSDRRIKRDILTLDNSLSIINKLNPVSYNFDVEANPDLVLPSEKQYGFIAQEIQEILPDLTKIAIHPAKIDENGNEVYAKKDLLTVNYIGFIALLTKGIQEQQVQIENQAKINADLQNQINELKKAGGSTGLNQTNNLGVNGFSMDQNIPNPFNSETKINYTIPNEVTTAYLAVYDLSGKQITSYPIIEKGSSSIIISSKTLAAGIYIYSIIADNKVVDSKRMIIAE